MEDLKKVQTPEEEISGKEETEITSSLESLKTDEIQGDSILGGGIHGGLYNMSIFPNDKRMDV